MRGRPLEAQSRRKCSGGAATPPAQMWHLRGQSRRRCAIGEASPAQSPSETCNFVSGCESLCDYHSRVSPSFVKNKAHPYVHAIRRGALWCVGPIIREPLPLLLALLCCARRRLQVDDRRSLVNHGTLPRPIYHRPSKNAAILDTPRVPTTRRNPRPIGRCEANRRLGQH